MKNLNFNPSKSTEDFRKNYKLHDIAECIYIGWLTSIKESKYSQLLFFFEKFGKYPQSLN